MKSNWKSTEGMLLDRNGVPIHELRVGNQGRRLPWVRLEDISPAALATIVRAEDKRFYRHEGVDWLAVTDAALDTLLFSRPRGASTISMQVAAQLDPHLKAGRHQRTLAQKWDQIRAAQALEARWTKRQILEAYLNLSSYRGEVQGIGAAARALFGKQASGLDARESLLLAVLLRGPNASPEKVRARACALGRGMDAGADCAGIERLARQVLAAEPALAPAVALAPHLARERLSPERPRVQTTLDGTLQAHAAGLLRQQLAALADRHVADGAILVADNRSGEVLAYVGNGGEGASAWYVDGVQAPRQAGSTLKPFLYEMAIGQRLLTAASLADDSPVNLLTPSGFYVPQNYDREFRGLTSVRTALSSSLNVPAVRTLMLVGAEPFVERLRELGFTHVTGDGDFYGYSLALGSAEVSLWELANAYRTLANGGRQSPLRVEPGTSAAHPVLDPEAAYVIADILSDPVARSVSFGLENPLSSRHWAAVKTGTSKDMRDNWCVGFTGRYTVAVWVGNFDGSPMHDVSGVTGAAPVWLELVNYLHRHVPSTRPPAPPGLVSAQVSFEAAIEPPRAEWFLAGTETDRVARKAPEAAAAAIAYPASGTILALDPDIPPAAQRVRLLASGAGAGHRFRLDGEDAGAAAGGAFWAPQPGVHVLELVDAAGAVVEAVRFEVRGAALHSRLPQAARATRFAAVLRAIAAA
ncbi:MAG TPA: penicillin-binding protein 1C [Burkholderiales bacterium]|nr:penicillin-binding protein 1C [Burkholderiales bacterium]